MRRVARAAVVVMACAASLAACGPKNFANQNDELRREREELRAQVADLERRLAEADARAAAAARAGAPPSDSGLDPGAVALARPECTEIEIDRLSGFRAAAGETDPSVLVVRLRTLDGRGRFTQVVGSVVVRAERVRPGEPTIEIGTMELGPVEVREAYRQGFNGSWYAVEIPVGDARGRAGDSVVVTAVMTLESGARVERVRVLEALWERWALGTKKSS